MGGQTLAGDWLEFVLLLAYGRREVVCTVVEWVSLTCRRCTAFQLSYTALRS